MNLKTLEIELLPVERKLTQMATVPEIPEGIRLIEAPDIWEESHEGEGSIVAILDTGADISHRDLEDAIIGGYNFTSDFNGDETQYHDNNGHGTHVAGTIAGVGSRNGINGVAPKTKLLILKVLTGEGSGQYDWIIDAINYVCDWRGDNGEKVSIMNLSLGGPFDVPELQDAVKRAVNECQISIVCASGNAGDDDTETFEYDYPASYNEVISVGAVDINKKLAPFSNVNEEVDLVAPGVDIISTYPENRYATLSGTSMAAPHVAGALALLKVKCEGEFGRVLTESELYAQLIKRTVPLRYNHSAIGNGLIQLYYMEKYRDLVDYITVNFGGGE